MKRIQGAAARRRTARGAVVAAAVLLGGMIPSAQAAAGVLEIDAELAYSCDFPSGERPVKVGLTATLPESAEPGQAIRPADVVTEISLPEDALAELADSGASTVSAETRLTMDVAQGGRQADTEWVGSTTEPVLVPEEGELALSTSGGVPYVRPGVAGDLSFEAAGLLVALTPKTADGTPTEPPGVSLTCVLSADQDSVLATVDVSGEESEAGPEATPAESGPGDDWKQRDPAVPEVGTPAKEPAKADAPPCIGDPTNSVEMVTYVTGYANVSKLNAANKFPLACARIITYPSTTVPAPPYLHLYMTAAIVLDYKGKPQLPPSKGTFLTFGFMPTTATLEMTQIPPEAGSQEDANINVHGKINLLDGGSSVTVSTVRMQFSLRLHDVEVNGVPLEVGNNCRTEKPFTLTLEGRGTRTAAGVLDGYTLTDGGPLTGAVTIPPFSGCGTDEDLDSLFTASLSGVPGFVKQMQGAPCIAESNTLCTAEYEPVDVPTAER